jgi:hypothetical protein
MKHRHCRWRNVVNIRLYIFLYIYSKTFLKLRFGERLERASQHSQLSFLIHRLPAAVSNVHKTKSQFYSAPQL